MTFSIAERYPYIDALMMGYINQDAAVMAGSSRYEDMIQCYINDMDDDELADVLEELKAYQAEHSDSLTADFMRDFSYGYALKDAERFFTLLKGAILMKRGGNYTDEAELENMAEWELAIRPPRAASSSVESEAKQDEQALNEAQVDDLEERITELLVSRAKLAEYAHGRGSRQHLFFLEMLATALDHEQVPASESETPIASLSSIAAGTQIIYGMAKDKHVIHFATANPPKK
ncbi:hypothetical protein CYR55_22795 [Chimaeribacter californicus]|uniref:CdiI immunity protein domain-containing protein n=1 Tax=Chimaeribacter californicus TaxID=2060067 RepID=A0A2N5DT07_9GAMM|nr:contact-dependent growth inhibition system immunity protein [Chimaeribacter californicus]PLR29399.1 hypothetical protein CYR55_22795 [Chimaeribacter californicus]